MNRDRVRLTLVIVFMMLLTVALQPPQTVSAQREVPPMMLGVHEQYQGKDATTPEATKGRYPLIDITREFKGGVLDTPTNLVPSFRNLCVKVLDAGLSCAVSFKLHPDRVRDGAWRPYVEQLCRYIVDNGYGARVVIIPWHEPEDDAADSFPLGSKKRQGKAFADGPDFVNYFNTVHGWVKNAAPMLTTSHAALGYGYRPKRGGPGDDSAWVPDPTAWVTSADIHAIDIYSGRSFPLGDTLEHSPAFKRWYGSRPVVESLGAPVWGVSERGWTADNDHADERVESIRNEFVWLKSLPTHQRPVYYVVWLTEGTEGDHNLKPDERMRDALNEGFALMHEEEPPPDEPPTPTPVTCPLCNGVGTVPPGEYTITSTHSVR